MTKKNRKFIENPNSNQDNGTIRVVNRNNYKVEFMTSDEVLVLLPHQTKKVSSDVVIPQGIGVYKK